MSQPWHMDIAAHARQVAGRDKTPLRLLLPEGCGDNLVPISQAFEEATGINIQLSFTSVDEMNTRLTLDSISGTADYDLALPATFGIPDLVDAGAILSLEPFIAKYQGSAHPAPSLYDTGDRFDGKTFGFQTDGDAYVMFYNRAFQEEQADAYAMTYGTPLSTPRTWVELDRQMAFFHDPDNNRYGGLLFRTPGYLAWEWWVRFHAKGAWPLSPDMVPQIAGDAGIHALEDMIAATAHLHPSVTKLGLFDNWVRYSKGDIYANIGWGGTQKYLNAPDNPMRDNMVFGATPGGMIDGALLTTPYFNWGWNYVVSAQSGRAELAFLFALFASSPEMSTRAVRQRGGFFDPFRQEHYDDPDIIEAYSAAFLDVHRQSMATAIPDLYLASQSAYFASLSNWLDRALNGLVTPAEALGNVSQDWEITTNRAGRDMQISRWQALRKKYPAQVQRRLTDQS